MNLIIDCHTHLQTKQLVNEYFTNRKGCVISIKALDCLIGNSDLYYDAVRNDKRIFCAECINVVKEIAPQLNDIENKLSDQSLQIVAIKIYLGYQPIYADDKKLYQVYEFAKKHNLSVIFHCGVVCSNEKNKAFLKYAKCTAIDKICVDFPEVHFVISHFDVPNFLECAAIVQKNENCFTDLSGILEKVDFFNKRKMKKQLIKDIKSIVNYFPCLKDKVMFGTDYFGKGSGFDLVEDYIACLKAIFGRKNQNKFLYQNCLKAYPKIILYK